ncbi:MAG: tetratricopeptide repeat protein [Acetilactobacillus jinshanensis]
MSILSKFIKANHHYNLAIDQLDKHKYQEALNEFNQNVAVNPRYTLAFINRGKLRQQHLHQFNEATDDYERALKLDPHDNQTRYRLAVLYQTMGQYQKSAHHFCYILKDVNWTKKNGASKALRDFKTKRYQSATLRCTGFYHH